MLNKLKQQQMDVLRMKSNVTGAEAVIQTLLSEDVQTIFGYPGGAVIPLYDAMYDYYNILQHILVRHEQGAIHAAEGYARATGKTGVVIATSGPGATNLVTGLADALMDSTPLVCITGQVYDHLLGTDAFQEADVINITAAVTKWNCQVTNAEEIADVLMKAFHIAQSGRPGPVLIDITKNAFLQQIARKEYVEREKVQNCKTENSIDVTAVNAAASLINNAVKPLVLLGQGVLLGNAETDFLNFIETGNLPVAWTILGASALPSEHPLNVGMLGMHGNYGPNLLTNECDVLIAVGMRFDDRVTGHLERYAKQAKIIHLDIDPSEINKIVLTTVGVCGNCKDVLPMLTMQLKSKDRVLWLNRFHEAALEEWSSIIQHELYPEEGDIKMGEVVEAINEMVNKDALIVTDVGQHQMVACRYAKYRRTRSNITSGGLGTMGFALPAAIGAKLGVPDRTVVVIAGDGGFQMTIQELGTVMEYKIPIKIVIMNNGVLGMVRQWQELFHDGRYSSVKMHNPDFVAIAQGYGIAAQSISDRGQLKDAVAGMLEYDGPYLLEIMVEQEANVFPMVPQGCSISEIRLK